MGLLNGGIKNIFGAAFAGLYLPATLYRASASFDEGGSKAVVYAEAPCKAQVDEVTWSMRQEAGYTAGDVRIIILAATLTGAEPADDDQITVEGYARYSLASVTRDPAGSHWIARGSEI